MKKMLVLVLAVMPVLCANAKVITVDDDGVGADFTWQAGANFNFQMTDTTSLMLGYRYNDFDYESGKGRDRFKFDIAEHGFAAGFRFDF